MKKIFLPIFLAASLLLPLNMAAEPRGNHRQHNTENSSSSRPGNNGNRPGNNGNRPGNNGNRPGNNGNRPGNGKPNHKPDHRPGNGKPNHKPDHGPGHGYGNGSYGRPGGHGGPGFHPGSSVAAPGHRPGPGYHHPPRLGGMVRHAIGPGRYDRVWMVAPGQYAVRFFSGGRYYMQYIWPETGRYGNPFQVIMAGPGQWYAYGNRNQWYYDDGNSLRISLNGSFLNPWTLIPAIELNINL